jgi:hypothetical protein
MRRLSLYRKIRVFAYVDDEDFARCSVYRWCATRRHYYDVWGRPNRTHWFVYTLLKRPDGARYMLPLARFILQVGDARRISFISENHLDCRKQNLKVGGVGADVRTAEEVLADAVREVKRVADLEVQASRKQVHAKVVRELVSVPAIKDRIPDALEEAERARKMAKAVREEQKVVRPEMVVRKGRIETVLRPYGPDEGVFMEDLGKAAKAGVAEVARERKRSGRPKWFFSGIGEGKDL